MTSTNRTKRTVSDLPAWPRASTPTNPAHVDAIPADRAVVVECGGRLWDEITLHRWHRYTLPALHADALLLAFIAKRWEQCDTDESPANRGTRARLVALAAEATTGGRKLDRRRAWRVIDWHVREEAPKILAFAGFVAHAEAYRSLPAITGPGLPGATVRVFQAAHRDTDKASTAAMKRERRAYRTTMPILSQPDREAMRPGRTQHHLELAAREVFPDIDALVSQDAKSSPLALGLQASAYAAIVLSRASKVETGAIMCLGTDLEVACDALVGELAAMGKDARS